MIVAAALCPAPPLLLPGLTGAADVLPELRRACAEAVADLVGAGPELVAVVGPGESTGVWDPRARTDVSAYAPGLGSAGLGSTSAPGLPVALGVGGWLLDSGGYAGERLARSVSESEPAGACAQVGRELADRAGRVGLLVMADGSACRGRKAPGYFDERSAGFDAEVERAVRDGGFQALLEIDAELASTCQAGALEGTVVASEIRYCDDPFGVSYLAASMRV